MCEYSSLTERDFGFILSMLFSKHVFFTDLCTSLTLRLEDFFKVQVHIDLDNNLFPSMESEKHKLS